MHDDSGTMSKMHGKPGMMDKVVDYLFPASKVLRKAAGTGVTKLPVKVYDDAEAVRQLRANEEDARRKLGPAPEEVKKILALPLKRPKVQ